MLDKSDFIALEKMMRDVVAENNCILRAEFRQDMSDMKTELRTEFKQDISELRAEFKQDMSDMKTELRTEFKQDISELKAEFKQDMANMKEDIKGIIKEEIEKSESFLLDEMERYYLLTNEDIQKLREKVDRIDQYYSVRRLEDEECKLRLDQLQMEVNDIKERLAM